MDEEGGGGEREAGPLTIGLVVRGWPHHHPRGTELFRFVGRWWGARVGWGGVIGGWGVEGEGRGKSRAWMCASSATHTRRAFRLRCSLGSRLLRGFLREALLLGLLRTRHLGLWGAALAVERLVRVAGTLAQREQLAQVLLAHDGHVQLALRTTRGSQTRQHKHAAQGGARPTRLGIHQVLQSLLAELALVHLRHVAWRGGSGHRVRMHTTRCAVRSAHLLLDGARRQEAVHEHLLLLAVTPHAAGGLLVVGGVPGAVGAVGVSAQSDFTGSSPARTSPGRTGPGGCRR